MIEQDVIGHLIDVERLAYDLLLDAETEADKRKTAAKAHAELEFRSFYDQIITKLENAYTEDQLACNTARDAEYTRFNQHLDSIKTDFPAFNTYLNSVLFGQ